jgi:hypothetical protein
MNDKDNGAVADHSSPAGEPAAGMPAFAVIGAQKSASTFLQDQLSLHPQIEIPDGEVRHFEDPFYSSGAVRELPLLYRQPATEVVRGIKRPDYLGRPEIAARLHAHLPRAKLFVVLRDPVARAVSSYYHFVRHGFVPLCPIDEAFNSLIAGEWSGEFPRSTEVLSFGLYGEHLQRYLEYYPVEQMMVLDQGPLTKNAPDLLRRAFEFVGVDPHFELPPRDNKVSNKGVYSHARLRLLRSKNRTRFRYGEAMDRRYPREMTPWGWLYNASVVGVDRTLLSRFDSGRPPTLAPDTRARLDDYYAEDRKVLQTLLPMWSLDVAWLAPSRSDSA